MRCPKRLLCCAIVALLSSTGLAKEPLPLNKSGEPIYVRLRADYTPVGMKWSMGDFKKGDVAMVTKIIDANYFAIARPPLDVLSATETKTIPEILKDSWIENPKFPDPQRVPRSKVDVISEPDAIIQAVSLAMSNVASRRGFDKLSRQIEAERTESEARREASHSSNLFVGLDGNGRPLATKQVGQGSFFKGWDENGQPITGRAQDVGGKNYYLGFDKNGQPMSGQPVNDR